jgi:hypothetical protein
MLGTLSGTHTSEDSTLEQIYEHEPVRAARRIIGDLLEVRDKIRSSAEGFAVLDFVQGHVATDLPSSTARDIVEIIRGERSHSPSGYPHDLVLLWLENYRRAYSHMIMRVIEDGMDPMSA